MRVLNVNQLLDTRIGGGTAERTIQMCHNLTKAGIDCTALSVRTELPESTKELLKKTEVILLPYFLKRFYIPYPCFMTIYQCVKKADVVHMMNHWTILNIWVSFFCWMMKKPYVLCPAGSLGIVGRSKFLKKLFNVMIGNRILKNASRLIAITEAEKLDFESLGLSSSRISIIPNGIDCQQNDSHKGLEFRNKHNLLEKKYFLYMGRLNPIKGPDLIVKAFIALAEELKDITLVLGGPDEGMQEELEHLIKKAGLEDRVHFIGFVSGEEKAQAYSQAELLIIPSRKEAMSIVVLEAGIYSTPVICTDQCGLNEVESLNAGIVVEASMDGIKRGLIKFTSSEFNSVEMGKILHRFTVDNFEWEKVVEQYTVLYQRILKS